MRTQDAEAGVAAAADPEPLFACTTADGTWAFVTLPDGCVLLRDGERVASGDASPSSVRRVLDEFLRVTGTWGTAASGPRAGQPADPGPGSLVPPGPAGRSPCPA